MWFRFQDFAGYEPRVPTSHARPHPSEEEKISNILRTLSSKPRPEAGRHCLICAIDSRMSKPVLARMQLFAYSSPFIYAPSDSIVSLPGQIVSHSFSVLGWMRGGADLLARVLFARGPDVDENALRPLVDTERYSSQFKNNCLA